jgi:high affinity Mn2+ porin
MFFAAQVKFKPGFFERNGNYRFLGWANDSEHTKWNDSSSTKESAYGFGISFDQELTDFMGVFLRYGWQDPDVYLNGESFSLERAWSGGIEIGGRLWGRNEDKAGFALGRIKPSDEYKKASSGIDAKNEGHFEAYYNYKVNEHLSLTPDIQVIWNPYGDDAANGKSAVTVLGMRCQVDF